MRPVATGDPPDYAYKTSGLASANHSMSPGCQNVVGGAHGVTKEYTDGGECLVGYSNSILGDNIYIDDDQGADENDTYLLSSEFNVASGGGGS